MIAVRDNDPRSINTALLDLDNQLKLIKEALGISAGDTINNITNITQNLVNPVDVVEADNQNAVTSNAVYQTFAAAGLQVDRIAEVNTTSAGNFSLTGDYKFLDYDIIIPVASLFSNYQLMFMPIPKAEVQGAINASSGSSKNERFLLCGSTGNADRRIRFGIMTNTTFHIEGISGTSGSLPHFYGFYGVKFKGV